MNRDIEVVSTATKDCTLKFRRHGILIDGEGEVLCTDFYFPELTHRFHQIKIAEYEHEYKDFTYLEV